MTNSKIIFGFTGLMGSGKDTAANYLAQKYGGVNYSFSTMLGDVLKRYYLALNRENYVKISEAMREKFGEDIMAKTMAEDVKNDQHHIVSISNVRRQADITYLLPIPGFVLVSIEADSKLRYERLVGRNEKADDKDKTYEQFLNDHKLSTEVTIPPVMEQATDNIDNNGSLENFYQQIDNLVKKYES